MLIGVPLETLPGEARVAVTPETAKKLKGQGHTIRVQAGAGVAASVTDEAYAASGADIADRAGAFGCDLVLKVRSPAADELALMKPGTALVGMLNPFDAEGLAALAAAGLTSFALEAAPRTTRAQSMDVLSSQANIAGYKAVMIAADKYQRFFPMLMTAAGTVKAARVVDPRRRRRRAAGHRHRQAARRGDRGERRAAEREGAGRVARRQVHRGRLRDARGEGGGRGRRRLRAADAGRAGSRGRRSRSPSASPPPTSSSPPR